MRILHVLAQLPAQTGSGIYFQGLIRGFAALGHSQRAIFACQDGAVFDFLPREEQYPVEFCSPALPFPIAGMSDIMPYPNTVYSRMNRHQLAQWQTAFGDVLRQAAADFQPEVVILHHLWMLASLAIPHFPAALKIGVCHNTDLRQGTHHPHLMSQYVTRLPQLDAVFALSEGQRKPIAAQYGIGEEKVIALGGGFDERRFFPAAQKVDRPGVQLVYASKIDPAKGIYALLDAFLLVFAAYPAAQLTLVGTPDAENAARLQPYLERGNSITLLPALPQAELAELFRRMDIYVMPSFFEGLGLTALEALACGLRVVATENPGLVELLGETVNNSGIIAYVPLPPMETLDCPCPSSLPAFVRCLAEKLLGQIACVHQPISPTLAAQLHSHSWRGIAQQAQREIQRLVATGGKQGCASVLKDNIAEF